MSSEQREIVLDFFCSSLSSMINMKSPGLALCFLKRGIIMEILMRSKLVFSLSYVCWVYFILGISIITHFVILRRHFKK